MCVCVFSFIRSEQNERHNNTCVNVHEPNENEIDNQE